LYKFDRERFHFSESLVKTYDCEIFFPDSRYKGWHPYELHLDPEEHFERIPEEEAAVIAMGFEMSG